jgi:DNA-binding LytR/AlgR family response regulator
MENLIKIGARTFVEAEQILFMESDINYTKIHYKNGSKQILSYTLKKVLGSIEANTKLRRISRQIVVNTDFVQENQVGKFEVSPGRFIAVSRRRKNLFIL